MSEQPLISILVPVYNEEESIGPFYDAVSAVFDTLRKKYNFELLFTDNCSSDRTFQILSDLSGQDSRVRVLRFSRNFGFQRSVLTGYLNSRGEAAIQIDVDLQDPPSLIIEFLKLWDDGCDVVYGIRQSRQEGATISFARRLFYRFIDTMSDYPLPHDAGDFRLVDRRVIEQLKSFEDRSPYLRGSIASLGFNQVGIPYDRNARLTGSSKFRLTDLISLAIDGIVSHSTIPLRLATYCGFVVFVLSMIAGSGFIIGKLFFGSNWPSGFPTLVLLLLISIGLNALFMGILGEYIGRIYKNVRKEPITIVDKSLGDIKQ